MKPTNYLTALCSASVLMVSMSMFATEVANPIAPPSVTCTDIELPVALVPGGLEQYQVYGQLCSQPAMKNRTIHVLVSGNTYDRTYWDFPYQPEKYSCVKALVQTGDVTFNMDRIGIGKSSRPPAEQVTLQSNAYVLHQVNQALRNGRINGVKFEQIVNVGHSFGSLTIIEAVSQYGGVDGVVLTGFLHNINPGYFQEAAVSYHPVQQDPNFLNQNLPAGYLTSIPGVRGRFFHNLSNPNTDPTVISLDEASKETLTIGEADTSGTGLEPEKSKKIKVPVLLIIGQKDYPFCTNNICDSAENIAAFESQFFAPEANLETFVLPDAGHSITLAPNAPAWYKKVNQWSGRLKVNS